MDGSFPAFHRKTRFLIRRRESEVTADLLPAGAAQLFRMQADSLLLPPAPSFFAKLLARFFLFCGNAKGKSEHEKFWKRIGGWGKERTFFKRSVPIKG